MGAQFAGSKFGYGEVGERDELPMICPCERTATISVTRELPLSIDRFVGPALHDAVACAGVYDGLEVP